jgi:starvation-inducible outer membrane lipoprotein
MKALFIVALALAGCTTIPADPSNMSPEQLKEWAKDKSASVSCVVARNATGTVVMAMANLDKTSIKGGQLVVKPSADCEMTIVSDAPAKP